MKMLVTVISSLLVGLSLASSNFSPIHELQNFLVNKRRIFISAGIAVTGFIFVIAGLLISLVESALQYDGQGFVVWSALFTVGAGLAIAGLFAIVLAKVMIPARVEHHQSMFAELNKQFNFTEALEGIIKHFSEEHRTQERPPAAPEPLVREENFAETRPGFSEPSRETLHH